MTKKNAQKYLLNVLEKFYSRMDGNFPEGYDVKSLENEIKLLRSKEEEALLKCLTAEREARLEAKKNSTKVWIVNE